MIDTIRLRSPYLSEEIATKIESESFVRQGIDLKTGDLRYVITSNDLLGSFDSRIQVIVKRETWTRTPQSRTPILKGCKPYIIVECSANKQLCGHNIFGGHADFHFCASYVVGLVSKILDISLPVYADWIVERIDFALCFFFENSEAPQEYLQSLNLLSYPRRANNIQRYGNTGIMIHGSSTCLKFYYKGAEFIKHDRSRLSRLLDSKEIFELTELANRIIRVEVELKKRKLLDLFGTYNTQPIVSEIRNDVLLSEYHRHVEIFLKETADNRNKVSNTQDVQSLLYSMFDTHKAGILFGFWLQMISMGESFVKSRISKPTFYRNRKILKDLGISFTIDANNSLDKKNSIAEFKPTMQSQNLLTYSYTHVNQLYSDFLQSQNQTRIKLVDNII